MTDITMGDGDQRRFAKILKYAQDLSQEHQWELGLIEMALGASLISLGVQNGLIDMGSDVVGSELSGFNPESGLGAATGGASAAIAGSVIGSIGIAGMGSAVGVPAALLIGGGALLLGAAGYAAGDIAYNLQTPPFSLLEYAREAAVPTVVGLALIVDGARRVLRDPRVLKAVSSFKDGVLYLPDLTAKVIVKTKKELKILIEKLASVPESKFDTAGSTSGAVIGTLGGTAAGSAIAAGSVTVLGSQTLGATALSLGLVSAPLWPVFAGGAAGLAIGYAAWKTLHHFGTRNK